MIVIETRDESRMLELLTAIGRTRRSEEYRPLFRWSVTDGLQRVDIALEPQLHNAAPTDVLKHIRAVTKPGMYVLLDFHPYLQDPVNVRLLKDICLRFADTPRQLVLVSHRIELPAELAPYSAQFEMALPSAAEREGIVKRVAKAWATENRGAAVRVDKKAHAMLIRNLAGLTDADTERLARSAIVQVSRRDRAQPAGVALHRGQVLDPLDIGRVAAATEGFSGAEIEQAIVSALYTAHAQGGVLTARHLLDAIGATRPLSVVMAENVARLRQWADGRTVPCD
jgi:hypothetical protein